MIHTIDSKFSCFSDSIEFVVITFRNGLKRTFFLEKKGIYICISNSIQCFAFLLSINLLSLFVFHISMCFTFIFALYLSHFYQCLRFLFIFHMICINISQLYFLHVDTKTVRCWRRSPDSDSQYL